ncbi:hypothetical protein SOVF_053410 [Spinacia oleracea]|uniref:SLH domain-containing protein n=1 Tax=Spinacia oleracea TaxID=3562 RepID=A0A9R0HSZ7_SPIOL|nr:uncharacterized protein LOC110775953 [Spinacia oleracea]KNA20323.1 hypothetical protein SOVF_053410 [Spinacia oleracea]
MCSSTNPPTLISLLLTHGHSLSPCRHRHLSPITFLTHYSLRSRTLRLSSAIAERTSNVSWIPPDDAAADDFGGWAVPDQLTSQKKKGFPPFLVAGIGTSIAVLVAVLANFVISKNGFRLPLSSSSPGTSVEVAVEVVEAVPTDFDASDEEIEVSEKSEADISDVVSKSMASEKHQPRVVDVVVDSNQQEALNALKKLKILDENVKANELCTRREYARWLVRVSSLLERNPKYKITSTSGSVVSAYEDVTNGDKDFDSIQALAVAGVVPSKLSLKHKFDGDLSFSPERFISRRDLIEWRSQLEYGFATTGNPEILKSKLDLMDVRKTSSDEWPGLFMDMLAGDRSLLRRVFGQIRRLQPNKPSTIAQVAVALTSGRMIEAIQSELLRMQDEESSRKAAKEEIRQELLDRGEIERCWAEKMEEEKKRGLEVQQLYIDAVNLLEQEKIFQEGALNGFLKEKAAMDCQKQLLEILKEEINEISERLASERTEQISDEEVTQTLRSDLQIKKEGILDAKSVLEAEIEALRILRSWIEDEAKKSKARSKVLEEVGQRWKWDKQL